MFYEDVMAKAGDTVKKFAADYGHPPDDWKSVVWDNPRNLVLASTRDPDKLQDGDIVYVPISWTVISRTLVAEATGCGFTADRNGRRGRRLHWVQTIDQGNQPMTGTTRFAVDAAPADDELPYYYTADELRDNPGWRKHFEDHPSRGVPPTAAMGTTRWRAVLSLAVVTARRATVWNSIVYGFNQATDGTIATVGPRPATGQEVAGHISLMRRGVGTGPNTFDQLGWTFRTAPNEVGDFVLPTDDVKMG